MEKVLNRRDLFKATASAVAALALRPLIKFAPQMGGLVPEDAFKSMLVGIARSTPRILNNLGLTIKVSEITAWSVMPRSAKRQALLNEVLKSADDNA